MADKKVKVLFMGQITYATESWQRIHEIAHVISPESEERQDFIQACKSGAYDGVVAIYRNHLRGQRVGRVDQELVDVLPKSLRYICQQSAGYDNIDVDVCTDRRIQISNCPTVTNDATANAAIFLLLGCLRRMPAAMASLRAGTFIAGAPLGHDPGGKVLGILGMGGIGRNLAAKARAFGMTIRYHNRKRLEKEQEEGAEYVDFEALLRESDVLSLHLPLSDSTRHCISTDQFKIMKKGAIIINTARGGVIDEAALVEALQSGQVGGAGLDVYENEPSVHPGLLEQENVLLGPHVGCWTFETQKKMEEWTISNLNLAITKGHLKTIVPEQLELEKQMSKE